jgi:DNA-binding NarL/FixJ family response regulator
MDRPLAVPARDPTSGDSREPTSVDSREPTSGDSPPREKRLIPAVSRRTREIAVLLIDDEPSVRDRLARTLRHSGLDVVGESHSGDHAMNLVLELRPDVVMIDIRLPGPAGIRLIEEIAVHAPDSRVLVLTRPGRNQVLEAIIAGATGYILKTADPELVVRAIRDTADGECVLAPQVAGKILEHVRELHAPTDRPNQTAAREIRAMLTGRELEIFTSLASGHSNHQIGDRLGLSSNTVSNHVKSILTKLHLHNRIEAAACAVRAGMS